MTRRSPLFAVGIGIEGTLEPVSGRDTLAVARHYRGAAWASDFAAVRKLGVREVRYPVPWHRIERQPGTYDWRQTDAILQSAVEEHGLTVIADTLHHTSYPRWLDGGFSNPDFPAHYVRFVAAFAERYPAIQIFTPFNEPTCTLDFCGSRGFWHPYQAGERAYVRMLRHTARATAEAIHVLRGLRAGVHILHVDTFQHHAALDDASAERAGFLNERRFVFDELLLGRIGPEHPLRTYLERHGFRRADLAWHCENPACFDERGGNYYPLNEEQLENGATKFAPSRAPRGFAEVARDYARRLQLPISLTETNIQGSPRDRISWLKYMLEQAEKLHASGVRLHRFAWYPLFDCAGWNSLLQGRRWKRDPQGVFSCGPDWQREWTELCAVYARVAAGAPSSELPAYEFGPMHDSTLGPLKAQMNWTWIPQNPELEQSAVAAR